MRSVGLLKMNPPRCTFCVLPDSQLLHLAAELCWDLLDLLSVVQELRDSFKLAQYILVTRVFQDPSSPAPAGNKKQKAVSCMLLLKLARRAVHNGIPLHACGKWTAGFKMAVYSLHFYMRHTLCTYAGQTSTSDSICQT